MTPSVSVIAPCYNHEKYVQAALRSVAAQTWPSMELIVVDDASSDDSVRRIHETIRADQLSSRFSRIEVVRKTQNGGAPAAINLGLSIASGDYLAIINTDDLFAEDRIEVLLDSCVNGGAKWGFSRCRFIDSEGTDCAGRHPTARTIKSKQEAIKWFPSVGFALLSSNVVATTGNLFLSKEAYSAVGRFSELKYCHDWDFALRLLAMYEPMYVMEELYYYRLHGENSYLALGDRADIETRIVVDRYLELENRGAAVAARSPGRESWPGLFELWCGWRGLTVPP